MPIDPSTPKRSYPLVGRWTTLGPRSWGLGRSSRSALGHDGCALRAILTALSVVLVTRDQDVSMP